LFLGLASRLRGSLMDAQSAMNLAIADLRGYGPVAIDALRQQRQQAERVMPLMPHLSDRFEEQQGAVEQNVSFLEGALNAMGYKSEPIKPSAVIAPEATVNGLMRQLVREWSADGEMERRRCFDVAVAAVQRYLPAGAQVIVPGAGLGRLVWELAMAGYETSGVEPAMTFLIVGRYVINSLLSHERSTTICPYAMATSGPSNVADAKHLARRVEVPDRHSISRVRKATAATEADKDAEHPHARLRILSCDFNSVATDMPAAADAVVTCFYIDASGDVVGAVADARATLRPGGVWINYGPLEYDGTDGGHAKGNLRLCADEVIRLVESSGFDVMESKLDDPCTYTQDPQSLLQIGFSCLYFVARLKADEGAPRA
jgi:carnosine N-methyltransferase